MNMYSLIFLIVGLALGLTISWFLFSRIAKSKIDDFVEKLKVNDETVRQFIGHYMTETELQSFVEKVKSELSSQLIAKISDKSFGEKVSNMAIEHVITSLDNDNHQQTHNSIIGHVASVVGAAVRSNVGHILESNKDMIADIMSNKINETIQNNADSIITETVSKETDKILDKSIRELLQGREYLLDCLKDRLMNMVQLCRK